MQGSHRSASALNQFAKLGRWGSILQIYATHQRNCLGFLRDGNEAAIGVDAITIAQILLALSRIFTWIKFYLSVHDF